MIFYAFTQQNLDIWSTLLDCPSKIKVANESLAAAMVEAVECLLSKLWMKGVHPNDPHLGIYPHPTRDQNISLCGTCPEIPYNIATHFCSECNENICPDCKRSHLIFRSTRDHVISPIFKLDILQEGYRKMCWEDIDWSIKTSQL